MAGYVLYAGIANTLRSSTAFIATSLTGARGRTGLSPNFLQSHPLHGWPCRVAPQPLICAVVHSPAIFYILDGLYDKNIISPMLCAGQSVIACARRHDDNEPETANVR